MRKTLVAVLALLAAFALFALLPLGRAASQQVAPVQVTNFPEIQKVTGSVAVTGTVRHATLIRRLGQVVTSVERHEAPNLVAAETIETDGFTGVVLSLQGEVRGTLGEAGTVGAVLVPAEKPIQEVFQQSGEIQFPLEVSALLARRDVKRFSAQAYLSVGFPRYDVYFYNGTDKIVDANLYVYLTN